jgi:hypothetical protein
MMMRLLDARFKYTPSTSTNVSATWRRFGYRPTTAAERNARRRQPQGDRAISAGAKNTELRLVECKGVSPVVHLTLKK